MERRAINAADAPANLKAMGTGPYYVSEFRNEDVLIIGGNAVTTNKTDFFREPDHFRFMESTVLPALTDS